MSLENILSQMATTQDVYEVTVPTTWSQGRTLFGGISAAMCFKAAQNLIVDERTPRSFHCNFIGPLLADAPVQVSAEILRTGKNVTQIMAKIEQNGQVGVMTQICFGLSRESALHRENSKKHDMPSPKRGHYLPQIPKLVPKFIQHFELAVDKGNLALGKSDEAILNGWSRLKNGPDSMDYPSLLAVFDAWPPTMFQLLRLPVPASTMSWDVEFISSKVDFSGTEWIASVNEATHIQDGYGHEESTFWTPDGEVLAYSRQVVTVFA